MNELAESVSLKKLSVVATAGEAIEFWRGHWVILWPWIMVGTLINGLGFSFQEFLISKNLEVEQSIFEILGELVVMIFLGVFGILVFIFLAISCHRLLLLPNANGDYHKKFKFSQREFAFFRYVLGVSCGLALVLLPGLIVFEFIAYAWDDFKQVFEAQQWLDLFFRNVILSIPYMYFVGRYSLVFPAIAIDMKPTKEWSWQRDLDWSWNMSKGSEWRVALLVGGLPLILNWVTSGMSMLGMNQWVYADSFVSAFLWFAFIPIEVAVLSIAFRELTNWHPVSSLSESTI